MGEADPQRSRRSSFDGPSLDLRLLRARVLGDLRRGSLGRVDVCDADRQLLDAAASFGVVLRDACPVCDQEALRHVAYGFGKGLPASGQVVGGLLSDSSMLGVSDLNVCIVEVCMACRWNFLIERRFKRTK
ncbi:DUF5318 family protein [Ferrimicrobium sp.]|uniref:DUF5318 family protein n=1 Tax=Ferrimicrobium sp. TaxID=2926050 RepID=UPI0026292F67|nr:DUF5318 family protein [Ferrimicrobium sp.]